MTRKSFWRTRGYRSGVALMVGLAVVLGVVWAMSAGGVSALTPGPSPMNGRGELIFPPGSSPFERGAGLPSSPSPFGRGVGSEGAPPLPTSELPAPPELPPLPAPNDEADVGRPDLNRGRYPWLAPDAGMPGEPAGWNAEEFGRDWMMNLAAGPGITVNLTYDYFYGYTTPNAILTATLRSGATPKGLAVALVDGLGYAGGSSYFWDQGRQADVVAGDAVDFFVNGVKTTVTLPTIAGSIEPATDVVAGTISGVPLPASVVVALHGQTRSVATDAVGHFSSDWGGAVDLAQSDVASVAYQAAPDFWAMSHVFSLNGYTVRPDYNLVYGYTTPGTVVDVTVRSAAGALKESRAATANAMTGGWNYYASGDIAASDQIAVQIGADVVTSTVSALSATVDVVADSVSGTAPAGSTVRVNFSIAVGTGARLLERTVSTGAGGAFSANFAADGMTRDAFVYVTHADTPRADTQIGSHAPLLSVEPQYGYLSGYASPGGQVSLILAGANGASKDSETVTARSTDGRFTARFDEAAAFGDSVRASGAGLSATIPIVNLTVAGDAAGDTIGGQAPTNAAHLRVIATNWWQSLVRDNVASSASGAYVSGVGAELDLQPDGGAGVQYFTGDDQNQHYQLRWAVTRQLCVNVTSDSAQGYTGRPGQSATLTLRSAGGATRATATVTGDADGWFSLAGFDAGGQKLDIVPGDRVTLDTGDGVESVTVDAIQAEVDVETDRVTGVGPAWTLLQVYVSSYGSLPVPTDGQGRFTADFSGLTDLKTGATVRIYNPGYDANQTECDVVIPQFKVLRVYNQVFGRVMAGTRVSITLTRGSQVVGTASVAPENGTFWTPAFDQSGNWATIRIGDVVLIQAGAFSVTLPVADVDGSVDAATGTVAGRVLGATCPAKVRAEVWAGTWPSLETLTDANGNFSVSFGAGQFRRADEVVIYYVRPDGQWIGTARRDLSMSAGAPAGTNVWGYTTPDQRVDLTLSGDSGVKATTQGWSDAEGWFNLFFSDPAGNWLHVIMPGDTIAAHTGNGKNVALHVPAPYSAQYDYQTGTVCGQAPAGSQLKVSMYGMADQWATVAADGSYCADFSASAPHIDDQGHVSYETEDGDWVLADFRTPAPDVWAQTWAAGQPAADKEFTWTIRAGNQGDRPAPATLLTDTLPANTTFVSASRPVATLAGNQVIWNLGALAPNQMVTITLKARVAAGVALDTNLENCAQAATNVWEWSSTNNQGCDTRRVVSNMADLAIDSLSLSPVRPAAGQQLGWGIWIYNNSESSALGVRITATLPASTTFASEWHPAGWSVDTSTPGRVVWQRDEFAGYAYEGVELRLRVAAGAPSDTQLHFRFEVSSRTPDPELWNNTRESDIQTTPAYADMEVQHSRWTGSVAPGQEYRTRISIYNWGNVPASGVAITQTLPLSCTFVSARFYDWNLATGYYDAPVNFPPAAQGPGWARWDINWLVPWRQPYIVSTFRIGDDVPADTTLVSAVDISAAQTEGDLSNNHVEHSFVTLPAGPNVRVDKQLSWGEPWPGERMQYRLNVWSNGSAPVDYIVLTDTLPAHVTLAYASPQPTIVADNQLVWDVGRLLPADNRTFWVTVRVNDSAPLGVALVNTAQAHTYRPESRDSDNMARVFLRAGGDILPHHLALPLIRRR